MVNKEFQTNKVAFLPDYSWELIKIKAKYLIELKTLCQSFTSHSYAQDFWLKLYQKYYHSILECIEELYTKNAIIQD